MARCRAREAQTRWGWNERSERARQRGGGWAHVSSVRGPYRRSVALVKDDFPRKFIASTERPRQCLYLIDGAGKSAHSAAPGKRRRHADPVRIELDPPLS